MDADHDVLIVPVAGCHRQVLEADLQFLAARLDAGQYLDAAVGIEAGEGMEDRGAVERARVELSRVGGSQLSMLADGPVPGARKDRCPAGAP